MSNLVWISICLIIIGLAFYIVYQFRKQMLQIIGDIEEMIDAIMRGSFPEKQLLNDETLSSKVTVKLKRLSEIMETQQAQTQEQHGQIQTLISDISHQVKTPISSIKMLNETLSDDQLPTYKRQEMQGQLTAQVSKLEVLVQGMLKASKLETGAVTLQLTVAPIIETIAGAVSGVALQAEQKEIELYVECPDDLMLKHDEKWTTEAIFNVLDNAVKYTPQGGVIAIKCERWEMYTRISITDTGIGISETEQAQVFQRFYRSSAVKEIEGVGIGLFLTHEIIQKQGGYLRLTSDVGAGTTLDLFLLNTQQID